MSGQPLPVRAALWSVNEITSSSVSNLTPHHQFPCFPSPQTLVLIIRGLFREVFGVRVQRGRFPFPFLRTLCCHDWNRPCHIGNFRSLPSTPYLYLPGLLVSCSFWFMPSACDDMGTRRLTQPLLMPCVLHGLHSKPAFGPYFLPTYPLQSFFPRWGMSRFIPIHQASRWLFSFRMD